MKKEKTYPYIAAGLLTLSMVSTSLPALATTPQDAVAPTSAGASQPLNSLRVLAGVHTDAVSMKIEDGKLNLFTYADVEEGNRTRLDPDQILFHLPINEKTSFKVTPGYDFIAPVGQEIYFAPQTQIQGVIWPGWNTEDIGANQVAGDAIKMELTEVEAPEGGSVEVFLDSLFGGAQRVWSSKDPEHKSYSQAVHSHVHGNWAFTKPGVYKLTFKASATLVTGQPVEDSQTYTFLIGDIPADPAEPKANAEPSTQPTAYPSANPSVQPSTQPSEQPTAQPKVEPSQQNSDPSDSPSASASAEASVQPNQEPSTPSLPSTPAETSAPTEPAESGKAQPKDLDPQTSTPQKPEDKAVANTDQAAQENSANSPRQTQVGKQTKSDSQLGARQATQAQGSTGGGQEKCYAQEEVVGHSNPAISPETNENKPAVLKRTLNTYTVQRAVHTKDQDRVTEGHFDFGATLSGGALSAKVKDDRHPPARWVTPQSLNFVLGDKAKAKLPGGMENIAPAGSEVYLIGATQVAGVPWLGWNTQDSELIAKAAGPASMSLKSFDGPGKLSVFLSGNFGAGNTTVFDSTSMGSFSVPMNTHQHGNWVFTAPGEYEVTIAWSVPMKDGSTKTSEGTLYFTVGNPAEAPKQEEAKAEEKSQETGSSSTDSSKGSSDKGKDSAQQQGSKDDAGQAGKPVTGSLDEATGIVTKTDGTQVRIMGKTASGADCALSASELKQAQQNSAAGKLAYTGFSAGDLALFGAGTLTLGALVLLAARRRKNA